MLLHGGRQELCCEAVRMTPQLFQRHAEVDASQAGERTILYHRHHRKAVVLNPTGSLIWTLLERSRTAPDLLKELQRSFPEVPDTQLSADLDAYLKELLEQDVVVGCPN